MNEPCSYSIGRRLSWQLALQTMLMLALLFLCLWLAANALITARQMESLESRSGIVAELVLSAMTRGGEAEVARKIESYAAMRAGTWLEVTRRDGGIIYRDPDAGPHRLSPYTHTRRFSVDAPAGVTWIDAPAATLDVELRVDFADDAKLKRAWAWVLVAATLAGGAFAGVGSWWRARRELRPLQTLAAQTRAISAQQLHARLTLPQPAEELAPWIDQFNALMGRLERAYAQLEGFNADVAHELRTPLATLIGQTEVALSRPRPAAELQDTLLSNLEELQRMSAMVNDMLFLSLADRGATARRGAPASLAALASQVVEFHEAPIADAALDVRIDGDAQVAVDEALFKRALSNLLGNATRFAEPRSQVTVRIAPDASNHVRVVVDNRGPAIEPQHLPRLFDRFFRADGCRGCGDDGQTHHGLGLAIVAAIARMHAGAPLAECDGGTTRIGFTLAAG